MEINFTDKGTYLSVSCRGEWSPSALKEVIMSVKQKATECSHTQILVDCTEVSRPKAEYHRFLAGREVAEHLSGLIIATLYPRELINKFTENTAVNRGATMLVTDEEETALQWLLDDAPSDKEAEEIALVTLS